jgi:hypothetical protein
MSGEVCPQCRDELTAAARAAIDLLADPATTREERTVAIEELNQALTWLGPPGDAHRRSEGSPCA